ncbi:MAG: InlB B-repeat-containing protein [Bacillota bacterium]|nr:InlB B-repeat-containing protein [Bacillota bacterium]
MKRLFKFLLCFSLTSVLSLQNVRAEEDVPFEEEEVVEVETEVVEEEVPEVLVEEEEEIIVENVTLSSPYVKLETFASVEEARKQYEKGSIDFFEACEDQAAITALTTADYVSYTNNPEINGVYDEYDATSLENMKDSLPFIKECNDLRAGEGVAELYITNDLMAKAQSNMNVSREIVNHSGQFNVGENLAWGYKDPFEGWYYMEKEVYDYQMAHPDASKEEIAEALDIPVSFVMVGHYRNVVNKSYVVTGFAVNDDVYGSYVFHNSCHSQVFYLRQVAGIKAYSYEDYVSMFMAYYNNVVNQMYASIRFDSNGSSDVFDSICIVPGQAVTITNQVPTRTGYTFVGWSPSKEDRSVLYKVGDSLSLDDSTTLYAQWDANSYLVQLNPNGGSCSSKQINVTFDSPIGNLPVPSHSSNEFIGWFTAADGGEEITMDTIYSWDSNMVLYAHWKEQLGYLESYQVTLSSKIGVNMYITMDEEWLMDGDNYLKIVLPNGNIVQRKFKDVLNTKTTRNGKTCLLFGCDVNAKELTDSIQFQVMSSQNQALGQAYTISLQDYLEKIIRDYGNTSYAEYAKTLLTYGYYAQSYFDYHTDNLPTQINVVEEIDLSDYAYNQEKVDGMDFVGARLVLKTKPGLKLYFLTNDELEKNNIINLENERVSISKEGKYFVVLIEDIEDMTKTYRIVKDNYKLEYSMYSYAQKATETDNENLKNLMYAMYAYNSLFH